MSVTTAQSNGKVPLHETAKAGSRAAAPGSRLAEAFEAVERFPVLVASRERVIAAATAETARNGDLVEAAESDVALAISILRQANRGGLSGGGVAGIPAAVEALKPSRTPEQRLREEREQLGIDHTLVGGVLARRWNLPQRIAVAIERHHADDSEGLAAMVAAADMVAHYCQGEAIAPERLRAAADRCGLGNEALRDLLYELPQPTQDSSRISEPCPLSSRELDVLRHLSEGMVYKQIAGEMHLSVSTIRTHLHNVYGKIGAVDRAQAVLLARDRGWI
jgi:DNA-binding NarL/FixJ family response regulator